MSQKLTGKSASVSVGGVIIGFTKIGNKTDRKLADATDSTNYDSGTDLIWPEQIAVMAPVKLAVEIRYNLTTTPANVLNILYTGAGPVAVIVTYKSGTIYGHGNFDIESWDNSIPVDDIITGTASFTSSGIFTFGS